MGRARTLANIVIATCLGVFAIGTRAANDSAFATSRHGTSSRTGDVTPVAWPGGGRFLAAPMVAGTDVMGIGAVRIVNGVVTGTRSNFDDAPPEMSLQTFAFVDHGSSGFSAVFRFVHPIVQLHAWRRIDVRHTITVVLTDPDGAAHAVELQPDGTTAVGTMTAGVFTPSGPSTSAIAGTVAVVDVPASLGVTSDWTVQGVVEVDSDQRLHPNNSLNLDTGYLAGTSIVPVGLLTGPGSALPTVPIVDALTTLMGAAAPPAAVLPIPAMRPTAVRFEGEGSAAVLVVTLAAPPSGALADRDLLQIDLVESGLNSINHPTLISWRPAQPGAPIADAFIGDANHRGSIPVTVSGNEVRLALGAATLTPPTTTVDSGGGLPMDQYTGQINIIVSGDETVSSADGEARFTLAETLAEQPTYPAPVKAVDAAVVTLNGPAITIQRASNGAIATGFIDAGGDFFATSPSDYYSGLIDHYGNASFYDASLAPGPDGSVPTLAPVQVDGDYDAPAVAAALTVPVLIGQTSMKGDLSNPPALLAFTSPVSAAAPWTERLTAGVGVAPAASQSGTGDWPLTAVTTVTSASASGAGGLVGPNGPFAVRVYASTSAADGQQSELGGPWLSSADIPALPTPAPTVDTTVASLAGAPVSSAAPPSIAASTASVVPTTITAAVARKSSSDGSSAAPWIVLVVTALAVGAAGALIASRRRRQRDGTPPQVAAPATSQIRTVSGSARHAASPHDDGHELGLRSDPGEAAHTARELQQTSEAN